MVTAGLDPRDGGRALAGRLILRAAADFARREDLEFDVLSLRGDPPATVIGDLPWRDFRGNTARLAAAILRRRQGPLAIARLLLFDLVGLARPIALLPRRLAPPFGLFVYGIDVWRPLSFLHRRALEGARCRWAISRHTVERARPFTGDLAFSLLPLCLEERAPVGSLDAALLERAGRDFFLIVGRMAASERYKGHDVLLEALAGHKRLRGSRLVVAGEGDDRARLEAKSRELGLGSRVLFTGYVSETTVRALHERASAFVMPSTGEGFGLVYLEAMRAARPCVAARGSAAEEIVEDERTGLLVDAGSPSDVAAALLRLAEDPAWARDLGGAGEERLRREFTFERFASRLQPGFDHLLAAARQLRPGRDVRN